MISVAVENVCAFVCFLYFKIWSVLLNIVWGNSQCAESWKNDLSRTLKMRLEEVRMRLFPFFFFLMSFTEFLNSQRKVGNFLSLFVYVAMFFSFFLLVGLQLFD